MNNTRKHKVPRVSKGSTSAWPRTVFVLLTAPGLLLLPSLRSSADAAGIRWSAPATIAGDADVYPFGNLKYAYDESGQGPTVGGVTFTAGTSQTTLGGGNITMSGFSGRHATAFGSGPASPPWSTLSAAYQNLLRGAAYGPNATTTATVNLNNLTIGHQYAVQFWVHDNRTSCCFTRTEIISSTGGNTLTLDYNSANGAGGVGQHTIGHFTATSSSQSFTLRGDASAQMNAIQVRDVFNLGYWNGQASGTWDGGSMNFCQNPFDSPLSTAGFDAVQAMVPNVYFADTYYDSGSPTTVTMNNVSLVAGGVTGANVIFLNNSLAYTISSPDSIGISGAYGVTVQGGGTVTLNGTHSYTGPTVVSAGTLNLDGMSTLPGLVSVSAGATLNLSGNIAFAGGLDHAGSVTGPVTVGGALTGAGTLAGAVTLLSDATVVLGSAPGDVATVIMGDLTMQGAKTLNFDLGASTSMGGGVNDLIQVTGGFTNTGAVTVNFNFTAGVPVLNMPYTLVTSGALDPTLNPADFTAPSSYIPATFSVSGNSLQVTFDARSFDLVWQGDLASNTNWADGTPGWTNVAGDGALDSFYNLDAVLFDDTATNLAVNVPGMVYPQSVMVNSAFNHYTFTGAGGIGGLTGLTKDGASTLTLTTSNSYSGLTLVLAGTLRFDAVAAEPASTALVVGHGAVLDLNVTSSGALAWPSTNTLTGDGNVRLNTGSGANNVYLRNDMSGFTGIIDLIGNPSGKLNASQIGASPAPEATLRVRSGSTAFLAGGATGHNLYCKVELYGGATGEQFGQLRVDANTTNFGPVLLKANSTIGNQSGTSSYGYINGVISDDGMGYGFTKQGNGYTVLSAANTFSGETAFTAGTTPLRLNHPLALQNSTVNLTVNNGLTFQAGAGGTFTLGALTGSASLSLQDSANAPVHLAVGNNGSSTTYAGILSGAGSLTKISDGILTLSGVSTHTGTTYIDDGILQLDAAGGINNASTILVGSIGTFDVSPVSGGFALRPNQTLAGFGTVMGSVGAPAGAILAPGTDGTAGTLTFNSALILTDAMLKFDLADTTTVGSDVNDLLALNGPLYLGGTVFILPSPLNEELAEGTYTLVTGITGIGSGDASNVQLAGVIRPDVTFAFVDQAAPSVSGVTNLIMTVAGTSASLAWAGLSSVWDVGAAFNWTNRVTGALDQFFNLDAVRFDDTLVGNADVTLVGALLPGSVTVSNVNTNYTFGGSGQISGSTGLIKEGAGTLTLSGANSHSGGTTVRGGTLVVANTGGLGTGAASVDPGAILQLDSPATTTFATAFTGAGLLRLNLSGGVNNTYVNNVSGFTGTIGLTNAMATGNKLNAAGIGAIDADLVILPGCQIYVAPGVTPSFRSIAVAGTGNTENRGAIRIGGVLGGPLSLLGDTAIGAEGGSITGDIASGAPGTQILTVGTGNSAGNATLSGVIGGGIGTIGLTKVRPSILVLAGANTYTGPTTINEGTVALTASGSISNTVAIDLAPGTVLDASAAGGLSLGAGQTLSGSGSVLGNVLAEEGSQVVPGGGVIGTLSLNGSLALSNTGDLAFQLGSTTAEGAGVNDLLQVNGDLALTGVSTVRVAFASAPAIGEAYTLINYSGALSGGLANLTVQNDTRLTFALDLSVPNKVRLIVSGAVANLIWVGGNPDNTWDLQNTANWDPGTGFPDVFFSGDNVTFENVSFFPNVQLVGTLQPADVNEIADEDYVFAGTGRIDGGRLNKSGGGKLTLVNDGVNTFAGGTFVTGGTLQVGNGGTAGALPNGPVTIDTTLVFHRSDDVAVSNAISGAGFLRKQGAGTLSLAMPNTYGGGTTVEAGTVQAENNSALGNTATALTVVSNGATLDLGSSELWNYVQPIVLNGAGVAPDIGALTKTAPGNQSGLALNSITLGSDASIGGVSGARIDIGRGDWPGAIPVAPIHIDGQGHTLSLVGDIYLGILAGAQNLSAVIINGGTSIAPHNDNSLGEAVVTLNGGTLTPWGANHNFLNSLVINGGFINNQGFMNTYSGPVQINGPVEINTISGGNITFDGNVSGGGSVSKIGAYSLLLGGDNSGFSGSFTNEESNAFFNTASAGSSDAVWTVNAGNLASLAVGTPTIDLGALAGIGGQLGNNTAGETVTYSIGALGLDTAFSGDILDSVGGGGTTAILKVGAGTQTLSGNNTYTGGTVIQAGTLEVTTINSLGAASSPLEISAGAVAKLSYTGALNVALLTFDGVPQAGGTWGATGSGAAHIDDVHFQGTGVLLVPGLPEIPPGGFVVTGGATPTSAITFDTEVGFEYRVVYTDSFPAPTTWPEVPPGWLPGTGGPLTVTDDTTGASQRFYRLERRP